MSPEMKRYKIFDHTSDIWALGCTISEMMTFKHYNFAFEMVAAAQEGKDFLLSLSKDMKVHFIVNFFLIVLNRQMDIQIN